MQERAFSELGIKAYYLLFELGLKDLGQVWKNLDHVQVKGFNVTVPYKETVISYLDRVSPEAKRIGAVNTVFKSAGKWCGTNTDVYGFLTSLKTEAGFKPKGKKALVFGAGGAARAAVYGLASEGAKEVVVMNRNVTRAQKLCREYASLFKAVSIKACSISDASKKDLIAEADLIVNATSLGLKTGDAALISARHLNKAPRDNRKVFYDLIYSPRETAFLKTARKKGYKTLNGVGMLVLQGAKAFEHWTRKKAPVSVMRRALLDALTEKEKNK